jgi:hypothetical protein
LTIQSKTDIETISRQLKHDLDEEIKRLNITEQRKKKAQDAFDHDKQEALSAFNKGDLQKAQTILDEMHAAVHHQTIIHKEPFLNLKRARQYSIIIGLGLVSLAGALFFPPLAIITAGCIGFIAIDIAKSVLPSVFLKVKPFFQTNKTPSSKTQTPVDMESIKLAIVGLASVAVFFVSPVIGMAGIAYVAAASTHKIYQKGSDAQLLNGLKNTKNQAQLQLNALDSGLQDRVNKEISWHEEKLKAQIRSQNRDDASLSLKAIEHITHPERLTLLKTLHELGVKAQLLQTENKISPDDLNSVLTFQNAALSRYDDGGFGQAQASHALQVIDKNLDYCRQGKQLPENIRIHSVCQLCMDTFDSKDAKKALNASTSLENISNQLNLTIPYLSSTHEKESMMKFSSYFRKAAIYGALLGCLATTVAFAIFCPPSIVIFSAAITLFLVAKQAEHDLNRPSNKHDPSNLKTSSHPLINNPLPALSNQSKSTQLEDTPRRLSQFNLNALRHQYDKKPSYLSDHHEVSVMFNGPKL